MRKVVYTCLVGDIDELKDPEMVLQTAEYLCFTDQPIKCKVWQAKPLMRHLETPRLTARWHKTVGCNLINADVVLWQDSKVTFKYNHDPFFDALGGHAIALVKHPKRRCVSTEARRAAQIGKVDLWAAMRQVSLYHLDDFPKDWGLFETAIVVRNRIRCADLSLAWWKEIQTHTERDQLSLPYLLWKMKIDHTIVNVDYDDNDLFSVAHHPFEELSAKIKVL